MRIAVLGGGPGGLYFAALAKQLDAGHEITVWERNAADDTFGFGVVFSDETLGGIEHADPEIFAAMRREFARWDDIDVHFRGTTFTSGGHGFAAMSRKRLLAILQARCASLGVRILFRTEAPGRGGAGRGLRPGGRVRRDELGHPEPVRLDVRARPGAAPVQVHLARHGPGLRRVQVLHPGHPGRDHAGARLPVQRAGQHLHPGDARGRVAAGRVRRRGRVRAGARAERRGLDRDDPRPVRGRARRAHAASLFANNSRWVRSPPCGARPGGTGTWCCSATRRTPRTSPSARAPSWPWRTRWPWPPACTSSVRSRPALAAYEAERRPVVASTQRAAQASLEWFENIGQYADQDPHQFAFNIVTRSRRVTYDNLRLRDPEFVADMDRWFASPGSGRARLRCGRRCSSRSGWAAWSWPTGSSSRRWTCTRPATACPATSTWCTWAARRSAGPGW